MKIALMLHGQARFWKESFFLNEKNLLKKYDVDVFCQLVWDDTIKNNGYYFGRRNRYPVSIETPDELINLYKPKKILIRHDYYLGHNDNLIYDEFPRLKRDCTDSFYSLLQFKGISEASKLFEWSDYDFIIKMRYDGGIEKIPDLYSLDKSKFYVKKDCWGTLDHQPDGFIDTYFILPNSFKNLMLIYDHLKNDHNLNQVFPPESVYTYYLNKLNLSKKLIKLSLDEFQVRNGESNNI